MRNKKETTFMIVSFFVGATGFEPAAAWSQTRSATGLRYTPLHEYNKNLKSGRQDSNLRPPGPKPGALPGCATPRFASYFSIASAKVSLLSESTKLFNVFFSNFIYKHR